jgi:hypothetical protein
MTDNVLTTIDFHGTELLARRGDSPATTLVAMKPVVEGMGLAWQSQLEKIKADPVLSQGITEIVIPSAGGPQSSVALPLTRVSFWLAKIQPNKVPAAIRSKVIAYQTECADVLFAHFFSKATAANELSAGEYHRIGGIVKAVTGKAIDDRLAPIEDKLRRIANGIAGMKSESLADPRGAAVEYRPMLEVLIELGVPPKGRRPICVRASARLRRWAIDGDRNSAVRRSRETGKYLFQVDAVDAWLKAEGRALIAASRAALDGQAALPLRARRPKAPAAGGAG